MRRASIEEASELASRGEPGELVRGRENCIDPRKISQISPVRLVACLDVMKGVVLVLDKEQP
jgi:hypothetical protein